MKCIVHLCSQKNKLSTYQSSRREKHFSKSSNELDIAIDFELLSSVIECLAALNVISCLFFLIFKISHLQATGFCTLQRKSQKK